MRVLVLHESKEGGSAPLAEQLGAALRLHGFDVDLETPRRIDALDGYDAIIVGAMLYLGRWPFEVDHFVSTHRDGLLRRPVWLYSARKGLPKENAKVRPVRQVGKLMEKTGAQGHMTFFVRPEDGRTFATEELRTWIDHVADVLERKGVPDEEREAEPAWSPDSSPTPAS